MRGALRWSALALFVVPGAAALPALGGCAGSGEAGGAPADSTAMMQDPDGNNATLGAWTLDSAPGYDVVLRVLADSPGYYDPATSDPSQASAAIVSRPELTFRCREMHLASAYLTTFSTLPSALTFAVRRWTNGADAVLEQWSSADRVNLFAPGPLRLLRELANKDTLWLEFQPANSESEKARFPVAGLAETIRNLGSYCGDPLTSNVVWDEGDVDTPVASRAGNRPPRYPAALEAARVPGTVLAEFTVDTSGRAEPLSIRIVEASAPDFADAVTTALHSYRFSPARIDDHPVRQRTRMPFRFRAGY